MELSRDVEQARKSCTVWSLEGVSFDSLDFWFCSQISGWIQCVPKKWKTFFSFQKISQKLCKNKNAL